MITGTSQNIKCPLSKNAMRIEINGNIHYVVYIEYSDKIPFQVNTISFISTADEPYWRLYWWDCFANDGDKKDIRLYNSGSGGCETDINAPQWANGYIGTYWLANGIKLKGELKNGEKVHVPFRVYGYGGSSINPFKAGEITNSREYCERCELESTEICKEHIYEDDEYTLRYRDDNSIYG